ncbi:hypothetical protein [Niveispirillum cyanobacteriorum]|nr:hypothetical protein [Niveispirillum cyanobacteriorum]
MTASLMATQHDLALTFIAPHNPKRFDFVEVWMRNRECQTRKAAIMA